MRAVWLWPLVLAGCAAAPLPNPAGDADATSSADIEIAQVDGVEAAGTPRALAALFRAPGDPSPAAQPESAPAAEASAQTGSDPGQTSDIADGGDGVATGAVGADRLDEAGAEPTARKGLFGFLRAGPAGAAAPDEGAAAVDARPSDAAEGPAADPAPVETAALAPRGGLFGGGARADTVAPGTQQPFGVIARVCRVTKRDLGTEVDRHGKWRLYDTIPNSAASRVMYLTGFDDKCARMFSAALVLFGTATAHETVRYTTRTPYSETDEAYEKIKGRICGVRSGAPCPADRLDKLEGLVSFVTAYPGFGASGGPWLDMLLFKGDLAASSLDD